MWMLLNVTEPLKRRIAYATVVATICSVRESPGLVITRNQMFLGMRVLGHEVKIF